MTKINAKAGAQVAAGNSIAQSKATGGSKATSHVVSQPTTTTGANPPNLGIEAGSNAQVAVGENIAQAQAHGRSEAQSDVQISKPITVGSQIANWTWLSIGCGAFAAGFVILLYFLPDHQWQVKVAVPVGVFLAVTSIVLLLNPINWHRRCVCGLLALLGLSNATGFAFDVYFQNSANQLASIHFDGTPSICWNIALTVLIIFFAGLDYRVRARS